MTVTPNQNDVYPVRRSGTKRTLWQHFTELIQYRELLYNLTVKELKSRYKNSILGFVWSLLNPLGMMLVFTVVFGLLMPNAQIRLYPIFLLCGLLPWNFFTSGVMSSIHSVVGNGNLVKKVYFPREILPIASVASNLINFLFSLLLLFAALLIFRVEFSPWLWLLPLVILMQASFILGLAFILSTLHVYYRDTLMVMDVVILAWFFFTPVFYSVELTVPATKVVWGVTLPIQRMLYILNPMASIIRVYRDLLYWGYRTDIDFLLRTAATSLLVLIIGYWFFHKFSDRFGEEV